MNTTRGLKVGVIGVGQMGRHHARILAHMPGVTLAGVYDPDQEQAREIAEKHRTKAFSSIPELIENCSAAILVSPSETHFEIASQCLAAGKHLLIEKPIADKIEDAENLVSQAKEKGLVLTVGHIERFNPAFEKLRRLAKKERIIGVELRRKSPFPERIKDASVVMDMMIHDLDLLLQLIDSPIESLKAAGKKIRSNWLDKAEATLFCESGMLCKVIADRTAETKERKIILSGERHMIEADLAEKKVLVRNFDAPDPEEIPIKPNDQLTDELSCFVLAVKKDKPLRVTAKDGLAALKLVREVEEKCLSQ